MMQPNTEKTVPYATEPIRHWTERRGLEPELLYNLTGAGFEIAYLPSQRIYKEIRFKEEIEASLPLEDATLVGSPVQKYRFREPDTELEKYWADPIVGIYSPEDPHYEPERRPQEYKAPEGMAFRITMPIEGPEGVEAFSFVGEYLRVDVHTDDQDELWAEIKVRGNVTAELAHVILGVGHWVNGPSKEDIIPLHPDKSDGDGFVFVRHSDVIISLHSQKHSAPFGACDIELVPFEQQPEEQFYIPPPAPKDPDDVALDHFLYIPAPEHTPHGFVRIPVRGGGSTVYHHPTSFLALPHIDADYADELFKDHRIILRWTSADDVNRIDLHLDRLYRGVDYNIRKYNSLSARHYLFQRPFVVHDPGMGISLDALVKMVTEKKYLSEYDLSEEIRVRRQH